MSLSLQTAKIARKFARKARRRAISANRRLIQGGIVSPAVARVGNSFAIVALNPNGVVAHTIRDGFSLQREAVTYGEHALGVTPKRLNKVNTKTAA